MLSGLRQDMRYATRTLAKSPGFILTTLISLALGIGINTAMFSVIHTAMDRPVSGRAPQELVDLSLSTPAGNMLFSFPEYQEIRGRARVYSDVMALMTGRYRVSGQGRPEFVTALVTTTNFFKGFGQQPALGRGFSQDQADPHEVLLAQGFWKRRFAADPGVVGKPLVLYIGATRLTYTIVGVLAHDFRYASMWTPDIVTPFPEDAVLRRGDVRSLSLMARVKTGSTMKQAKAETELLVRQLAPMFPESLGKAKLSFWPKVRRDGVTRTVAAIVQAVVGLILLIACANVMNLLLARHQERRFEMATRLALGASAGRITRQLLTESLLLAVPSALAGYGVAVLTIHMVEKLPIPGLAGINMYFYLDRTVLGFAMLAGVAASVIAGLWPARAAAKLELMPVLKGGGATVGRRKFGVRGVLVAAQLALSMVGITAAAMLTRSVWNLNPFDPGVDPHKVFAATLWPMMNDYSEKRAVEFRRELETRLKALPGARAVAFAALVPGGGENRSQKVINNGSALLPKQEAVVVRSNAVSPGFFRAFGIQLLRGREYAEADQGGRPLCVVNETMARRFWLDQEPLGQTVRVAGPKATDYTVIGVARDTAYDRNGDDPAPFLYLPLAGDDFLSVFVRGSGDGGVFAEPLRRTVASLDPEMPLQTMDVLAQKLTGGSNGMELRLRAGLMGTLGGTALLLSGFGLYGAVAYIVSRRTREIGIRLALGASRADVLAAVLKDGFRLVAAGMASGVALSLVVCPLLANHLFGVTPNQPAVIAASCGILGAVATLAMLVPASRACRLQALSALRYG
jgi:putative ABC transport system permease protein